MAVCTPVPRGRVPRRMHVPVRTRARPHVSAHVSVRLAPRPAGFMQPQGHVQVLLNWLRYGMHPQAALDAPRLCLEALAADDEDAPGSLQGAPARAATGVVVYLEEGFPPGTAAALEALGHRVRGPLRG